MKAIVQERYGPPEEVLVLREVEPPVAGEGEVLVRVRASCAQPDVWHAVTGRPYALRFMGSGVLRPRNGIPGMDVAGRVETVGEGVTRFAPGDAVFGATREELVWQNGGSFAEYVAVPEGALALKPERVSFEQAASVPTSGFITLLNLRGTARPGPGKSVLVNGAAGGVGSIAVQLGKAKGARVTGVDGPEKLELVRSLGADAVIDYTREDFTRRDGRYDLILDVASTLTLREAKRALTPAGVYLVIGHDHFGSARGRLLGSIPRMLLLLARSRFDRHLPRSEGEAAPSVRQAMAVLAGMLAEEQLTPVVDRAYPLAEAAEAMLHLQSGRARGRIVITP